MPQVNCIIDKLFMGTGAEEAREAFASVAKFKYFRRSTDGSVGVQEALDSILLISLFSLSLSLSLSLCLLFKKETT